MDVTEKPKDYLILTSDVKKQEIFSGIVNQLKQKDKRVLQTITIEETPTEVYSQQ